MTTLSQSQRTAALSHLEKLVSESGATLRTSDVALFTKLMRLIDSVRLGRATGAQLSELSVELGRWHLQQQRAAFVAQLATLAPFTAQGLPWALDTAAALEALVHLLDRTLAQTRLDQRPTPTAVETVSKLSEAVKARVENARRSIAAAKQQSATPLAARASTPRATTATPARALRHIAVR